MTTAASVRRVDLSLDPGTTFIVAESEARSAAYRTEGTPLSLVAWWDSDCALGGAPDGADPSTYREAAEHAERRGAVCRVHVNRGQYEYFYGHPGSDTEAAGDSSEPAMTPSRL